MLVEVRPVRHISLTVFFAKNIFQHSDKKLTHYGIRGVAAASPVGLGAVLTQPPKDGARITSYASRSLTETERRYSKTEKEALVLVLSEVLPLRLWNTIRTYHSPQTPRGNLWPQTRPCAHIER